MSLELQPKNPDTGSYEFPNGFWPALCVETPVADLLGCEYTDRGTIRYEHDGYVGDWFSEVDAKAIRDCLLEYIQTEDYRSHRYFAERENQMDAVIEFLEFCGGFRMVH